MSAATLEAGLGERTVPFAGRVVGDLLLDRAERAPDRPFVRVADAPRRTYGEVADRARRVAGGLARLGVGRGTPVAVLLTNREEHLLAWFALALLGAVEVPVNTALKGSLLHHVLADSRSELAIADAAGAEAIGALAATLPDLRAVVRGGSGAGGGGPAWEEVADGPAAAPAALSPSDPVAVMYTSGTTGPAKGVVCPHGYFACWADDTARAVRFGADDVLFTPLPLFHITAQAVNVLMAVVAGGRVELDARFSPAGFWERMATMGVTHVWAFGSMTPLLHRAAPSPFDRAHAVRVLWSIPWPAGYGRELEERFGVRVLGGYGSTEQGLTVVQPYDAAKPDTAGRPSPHYEVAVVGEDGRPVGPGEVGEIVTRPREPASMMSGYLGRPEATAAALRDLWYHTGDRAVLDEDGYVRFVDRAGDAIRRRGENISAWEIESVVARHPAIDESAAIGVASELGEHDVMLVAVARAPLTERELFDYCRAELPYYMVPRYVELVEELPKTPSLRVQKFRLRERGVTAATWDCEAHGIRVRRPAETGR